MRVIAVSLRDFRSYGDARASLGEGLTVVCGPNGVGKTNLLEAVYFGCTGRSCRTTNERELVHFGADAARVVIDALGEDGPHELSVGFAPGQPKRMRVDGSPVERLIDVADRPLVSVFLPDRLELVKGAPAVRRAHLDQFVAAMWPARALSRRAYAQALAQRNALLGRVRAGQASADSLTTWDSRLASCAIALMTDRAAAVDQIADGFTLFASELGIDGHSLLSYRPRSRAADSETLAEELRARVQSDLERGFTGHGPHRDDLSLTRNGRELRTYGSQGQQRLALLALLLAERQALATTRRSAPLMLLDDVMSELDRTRRQALVELLRTSAGQSVITTTDLEHVPGADQGDVARLAVHEGQVREALPA